jgi:hypothetical protein
MQHPSRLRFIPRPEFQLDPECLDIEENGIQRQKLFDSLPELLKEGSSVFKTDQEKLLFLYLTIAAISGLLTNVTGQYRQRTERPNHYSVGIGRPASGKGLIVFVQMLLLRIQEHYMKKAVAELKKYQAELASYKIEKKQNPNLKPPQRPKFQVPLIPAVKRQRKVYR